MTEQPTQDVQETEATPVEVEETQNTTSEATGE